MENIAEELGWKPIQVMALITDFVNIFIDVHRCWTLTHRLQNKWHGRICRLQVPLPRWEYDEEGGDIVHVGMCIPYNCLNWTELQSWQSNLPVWQIASLSDTESDYKIHMSSLILRHIIQHFPGCGIKWGMYCFNNHDVIISFQEDIKMSIKIGATFRNSCQ